MSSLDPALSRSLMELLQYINREDGLTVIASLHVLDLAVGYGGRIVGLRAGKIVHDGPPAAMSSSAAEAIFGGARP
jgi:phosphonate transport system ATP-binding protein